MFVIAFAVPIISLVGTSTTSAQTTTVPPNAFALSVLASAGIQWFPIGILYLLLRRRGGWSSIGMTPIDPVDMTAGVMLWLASHVTVLVLAVLTQGFGSNNVEFLPRGLPVWELALLSLVIAGTAGFVEEILVRGYAQTRLQQLGAPAVIVVAVPTALWAVLHLYQGIGPAVTIFGLGLVYAIWFQLTRRLWPVVIAHALFDLSTLALIIAATLKQ
jgi:membrane protease YdiL (CAAX protease family)